MSFCKCRSEIEKILAEYGNKQEALIPCLHAICAKCGYLSEKDILFLSEKLNLPKVEIYSVATFYSMFNLEEKGKYIIRVCISLPCYLEGSKEILKTLKKELNIKSGQTTKDKKFTIETVSCLGVCDKGPVMMINEKVYENLTPKKVREIILKLAG